MDKRKKRNKQITNLLYFMSGMIVVGTGIKLDNYLNLPKWEDKQVNIVNTLGLVSPVSQIPMVMGTQEATRSSEKQGVVEEVEVTRDYIIKGKISYYSWEGCLGCDDNRIQANGEQLDDSKYTIALYPRLFKQYKNQIVTVENLDNGKKVNCKVTDSGGFEKYNRVADLSKATYDYLGAKTDVTNIVIYQ